MSVILVIGATGDVGRGIAGALKGRGHHVLAIARDAHRLAQLEADLGVETIPGSVATDEAAQALLDEVKARVPAIDGVAVAINAPRQRVDLLALETQALAAFLASDLVSHFTAARTFVPALRPGGTYVGIGGGSADFVLEGGAHMSIAQAGLRMMHRALAFEAGRRCVNVKQLTVASVVNGATTRAQADPAWVRAEEIGEQVAALIERPGEFLEPVWRIARRDGSGRPVVSHEGAGVIVNRPLVPEDHGAAGVADN